MFAGVPSYAAAVVGREAERAGEAGCASSLVPSFQLVYGRSGGRRALGSLRLAAATFAGMSIRKFAGEDTLEPFLEWVGQKPKGYVLNTDSDLSDRASTRLHRASCFTLDPGFGGGVRQTVDYIKVCSPEPKELNEWAVGNLGYGLRSLRCQHCEPSSLGLTD
jgi:hypothetical protein